MNAGIWIRVSTQEQTRGDSPDNHLQRATKHAESQGWTVVSKYNLSGTSGKRVLDHPEAQRMIADVRSGRIKVLIFSKLARLARNTKELLKISEVFQECGATLAALEEKSETETNIGRLLYTFTAALAEWEREEIAARVAASIPARARSGKPLGGPGPYGYRWVIIAEISPGRFLKRFEANPDEAVIVRRLFELFLETKRFKTTASRLNAEGYRARRGGWTATTVKRILMDPVYYGERIANYSRSRGNKKSWTLKPESEWVRISVEPIVAPDTWNRAQTVLAEMSARYQKRVPKEGNFLFSGLLTCTCGTKLYVNSYRGMKIPRYICRGCKNKIGEDEILACFRTALQDLVLRPEMLECQDFAAGGENAEQRLSVLRNELAKVLQRIERAHDLYADDKIDKAGFEERYQSLRLRREAIESEMPRLQAQIDATAVRKESREYVIQKVETFSGMWDELDDSEKRQLSRELVSGIRVGKQDLKLTFFYLPEFTQLCNGDRTFRGSSQRLA